jgi:hypothetical protein
MVTREYFGRTYKLVASTEKRVGTVLMAIRRVDLILSKPKRPRITKAEQQVINLVGVKYSSFERGLTKQISEFKERKKVGV